MAKSSSSEMRNKTVAENTIYCLVQAMVSAWKDHKGAKPCEYYGPGGEYKIVVGESGDLSVNVKG